MTTNMLARMLVKSPVAPFLAAQFALLWRQGRGMSGADMGHLFPAMIALAQAALAPAGTPETEGFEPGRLAAACRFIRAHLGDEDLCRPTVSRRPSAARAPRSIGSLLTTP